MAKEKNRSEVEETYKWNLNALLKEEEIPEIKKEILELTSELETFKGHILESSNTFAKFYEVDEKLSRLIDQLSVYSYMNCDVETTDSKRQGLKMEVESLLENISERLTFIEPEILSDDYETIKKYIEENDSLKQYQFSLEKLFRQKEHTLSE